MKPKPKVVFDTNIFISSIIFGGNPRQCLELAREAKLQLYSSRSILLELAEKLREKFLWEEKDVQDVIEGLLDFVTLISPEAQINVVKNDPDDNKILECSITAGAEFIVSGDKHLTSLKRFEDIPILSAKQFLDTFYRKPS